MGFYETYGFVIVDKVIDQEDIDGTIDEIWNYLENQNWSVFSDGTYVCATLTLMLNCN